MFPLFNNKTPYKVISIASPTSKSDLEKSGSKVGATVVTQINHPNDPVIIPNSDASYTNKDRLQDDLEKNHPFAKNYNKVKKVIDKLIKKDE